MDFLEKLTGVKSEIPEPDKNKPPIYRQVSNNGGYSSEVIYDRFQIMQSFVIRSKYVIVDHDSVDGGLRDSDGFRMLFDTIEEARNLIDNLVHVAAKVPPGKLSFRAQLHKEYPNLTAAVSTELLDVANEPSEGTVIRMIYDLLIAGMGTTDILRTVVKKFPHAPHRANFIDEYRTKLIAAGKAPKARNDGVDMLDAFLAVPVVKKLNLTPVQPKPTMTTAEKPKIPALFRR